jgi:phosphatidylinositol-3-phosphatase
MGVCIVLPASAGFVAFNDYAPGYGTHVHATIYGTLGQPAAGGLTNISDGLPAAAAVTITSNGVATSAVQGVPPYGTPASVVFDGFVDFSGTNNPSLEVAGAGAFWTYTFTGLDPGAEYNFQGTAVRGNSAYTNRWTLFEITGMAHVEKRHTSGALTAGLATNQVAVNTGNNIAGDLAWWEHIRPGASGSFAVTSRQYLGPVPGGSSGGAKGYGMTGFRLEQNGTYTGRTNLPPRLPNQQPNTINGLRTVFLIMLENHNWSTIKGSPQCSYINNTLVPLASHCEGYYNPPYLHPSEPNYLWLVAGTNFGVRDDNPPSANQQSSTNTLFHQLDLAGLSWKTYQENISGTSVPDTDSYPYAVRHNPFVFFDMVRTNLNYCTNHVRPYSELALDLAHDTVPRFNFISPNLTNDMHDVIPGCSTCDARAQGDAWLSREVPKILAAPAYTNGGAVFITFDEGTGTSDGPIAMLVLSPRAKGSGYFNDFRYDHSSTLRTIQDIFGLRPYLGEALYATSLSDLFLNIQLASARWDGSAFTFVATNLIPGKTNLLQVSTNVAGGAWTTLQTNRASATSQRFTNSVSAGAMPRFYRVLELP